MIRRAQVIDAPDASGAGRTDSIESWLDLLAKLLRVPRDRKQAILDELESHLRERVRDLVLAGAAEPDALRAAVAELGDAAELAHHLALAHRRPLWRLLMNIAVASTGVAALVTATVMVSSAPQPGAVFYAPPDDVTAGHETLADFAVSIEFNEVPLEDVFAYFAKLLEADLVVHWHGLGENGIQSDWPVSLKLERGRPLPRVLSLIAEQVPTDHREPVLDWRYADDLLEFGTVEHFDRREVVLGMFDLTEVVESLRNRDAIDQEEAAVGEVSNLIHEYVESDAWAANGGRVAQLTVLGKKMFVRAPARFHAEIGWILEQLVEREPDED